MCVVVSYRRVYILHIADGQWAAVAREEHDFEVSHYSGYIIS